MPISNSLRAEMHGANADHDVINFNSSSVNIGHRYDRHTNEPYYENQNNFDVEEDQNDNQDSLCMQQLTVN